MVPSDVHLASVDQLVECVQRQLVPAGRRGQGHEYGVVGGRWDRVELLTDPGQLDELYGRSRRAIADVIDTTGQGVHRGKGVALGNAQQPDAVPEVLGFPAGDLLAGPVGGVGVHRDRLTVAASPSTNRSPSRSGLGRHG